MTGIISYGIYIPKYRIKTEEIAKVWGKDPELIRRGLGISEKSVAALDEDAITMGYESAWRAVKSAQIKPTEIDAVFVGSESHPYVVNPSASIIADYLGVGTDYFASDMEFACKAATTGIIVSLGLIASKKAKYALAIGSDNAQAKLHDSLEYSAASAAATVLLGSGESVAAEIVDYCSYTTDTPDFWRRDGESFPSHSGRFTGEPAYFTHVLSAAKTIMKKTSMKPSDFDYCVFHMPNGKFPRTAAKRLGFSKEQLAPSLTVDHIGNPYSASSLMGLAAVLDQAGPNQTILLTSYGSGAGSDAFVLKTTPQLSKLKKRQHTFLHKMQLKQYIGYTDYLKFRNSIAW